MGIAPVNLGSQFDAMVVDRQQAPPPELPVGTVQVIGTRFCKMPPGDVSSSALNYDSSDD